MSDKWASYDDLLEIDKDLMGQAIKAASYYCCDAVNLVFRLSSTTSGMYSKWYINISPDCTVYFGKDEPFGMGGHINEAFQNFIESCNKNEAAWQRKRAVQKLAESDARKKAT